MPVTRRPAARQRGRPLLADAHNAREALLDAAVARFAELGVAASSTSAIARSAGLTPAMVHYYFGSRDALIDAVIEERLARFIRQVFSDPVAEVPAGLRVASIVDRIFDGVAQMPWVPSIWIREIVSDGGLLRERMLRHLPRKAIADLAARIAEARVRGEVGAGVEPALAFISIMGLAMFPLATQSLWRHLPGAARIGPAQLRAHALAVLGGGLAPPPPQPR